MAADKASKLWLLITGILTLIIISGSVIIWARKDGSQPISIVPSKSANLQGDVYVYGAVANPGIYPLKTGDSIESLIQASGGTNADADLSCINIYVPESSQNASEAQKINLNLADSWLLEALPEIGASRARDIIAYRQQHGTFHSIDELQKVPGISSTIFEKIKDLITVMD